MDKKSVLNAFLSSFFGNKDDEMFNLINSISKIKKLEKKEQLFIEGSHGRNMYFVHEGSVKLYKTSEDGKEMIVNFVSKGDVFAEILLQLNFRYPVSSMALENCTLLEIDAAKLSKAIEQDNALAMKIIAVLAKRIKYFIAMIENLTMKDVRGRFVNYLSILKTKKESNTISLPVAKGEIALLLGTTPETFSRLLKKLVEEGIIEVKGKEIKILKEIMEEPI